ncbi:hypothetical protein [uncultured Shewanella sp.]|uniref:hypothetical protein n=1 Tax=uncultured Shewanella sp. TaxID=173975 RepID=UPI00260CB5EF|nr:hypothetical protein [uncultured Shewanella sp.]
MFEFTDNVSQKDIFSVVSYPSVLDEAITSQYSFVTENAYLKLQIDYIASPMGNEWSRPYYTVLSINHLGEFSSGEEGYVEEYPDVFHDEDSEIIFESDSIDELYRFLQSQSIQG